MKTKQIVSIILLSDTDSRKILNVELQQKFEALCVVQWRHRKLRFR